MISFKTSLLNLVTTMLVVVSAHATEEPKDATRLSYMMYSEPMYLRLADGAELKLRVTAYANRRKDKLSLSVNDEIVDEAFLSLDRTRTTLRYSEPDLELSARCRSLRALNRTYNHACTVFSGRSRLGVLEVNQRIYPKQLSNASAKSVQAPPDD